MFKLLLLIRGLDLSDPCCFLNCSGGHDVSCSYKLFIVGRHKVCPYIFYPLLFSLCNTNMSPLFFLLLFSLYAKRSTLVPLYYILISLLFYKLATRNLLPITYYYISIRYTLFYPLPPYSLRGIFEKYSFFLQFISNLIRFNPIPLFSRLFSLFN